MAILKQLTENKTVFFPITHEKAIFDDNGINLDNKLSTINTTINTNTTKINENKTAIDNIANNFATEQTGNTFTIKYNGIIIAQIPINASNP